MTIVYENSKTNLILRSPCIHVLNCLRKQRLLEYVYKNYVDLYSQSEQSLSDVDQDFVLASTGFKNPI